MLYTYCPVCVQAKLMQSALRCATITALPLGAVASVYPAPQLRQLAAASRSPLSTVAAAAQR